MLRYRIVKKMLVDMLAAYPSGVKLPPRTELCLRFDTTRMTLDKAMHELEQEGLIRSRRGSGTYTCSAADRDEKEAKRRWGVIVPTEHESLYTESLEGIRDVADQAGIELVVCYSGEQAEKQAAYFDELVSRHVEGMILIPSIMHSGLEALQLYRSLSNIGIPMVFINREVEGITAPVVKSGDFYGGYLATKHLLSMGYRRIAFLSYTRFRTAFERCQGYVSALMEAGIPVNYGRIYMPSENSNRLKEEDAVRLLMDENPDLDGIFCFNDRIAKAVYRELQTRGKRVSKDVGVVGFVNMPFSAQLQPPLTTVDLQAKEIGSSAAEILKKLISGYPLSNYNHYLTLPLLIERESCRGIEEKETGYENAR